MQRLILAVILVLLAWLPRAAHAESAGHGRQFGFRAALVGGYEINLRYDKSPYCRPPEAGQDPAKVCGYGTPLGLDLALSFAPLDSIEPFAWLRLGLNDEKQTGTRPLVLLGAGARIYTLAITRLKLYVEPALAVELQDGGINATTGQRIKDKDMIFHLAVGPQFDITENIGVYADGGLTVGILRSIHSALELKAGLQARFP
jgi:hypothetical protein